MKSAYLCERLLSLVDMLNSLPRSDVADFLLRLRRYVERNIDSYKYTVASGSIGQPMSATAVSHGLAEMRESLIEPFWSDVNIRDTFDQVGMKEAPKRRCAVVADDGKGIVLVYDPSENDFVLAQRTDTGLTTFGVRGDAVGCFLAR